MRCMLPGADTDSTIQPPPSHVAAQKVAADGVCLLHHLFNTILIMEITKSMLYFSQCPTLPSLLGLIFCQHISGMQRCLATKA